MTGFQSRFGGGIRFGPGVPLPQITKWLIISNVAIWFLQILPGITESTLSQPLAFHPDEVFASGRLWQFLSYMFLHGNSMHLLVNMLMLWMFGSTVEHAWGSRDFLQYYLICGVGAALLQFAFSSLTHDSTPMIGASGAVYGIMVAFAMIHPDRILLVGLIFPMKTKYFIWGMIGLSLFLGLGTAGGGVAHFAHLGGVLTGWLYLKQDWRLGAAARRFRGVWARDRMRRNARRVERKDERRQERAKSVDEILDKITSQGIDSLTEEERRILRESSR